MVSAGRRVLSTAAMRTMRRGLETKPNALSMDHFMPRHNGIKAAEIPDMLVKMGCASVDDLIEKAGWLTMNMYPIISKQTIPALAFVVRHGLVTMSH